MSKQVEAISTIIEDFKITRSVNVLRIINIYTIFVTTNNALNGRPMHRYYTNKQTIKINKQINIQMFI